MYDTFMYVQYQCMYNTIAYVLYFITIYRPEVLDNVIVCLRHPDHNIRKVRTLRNSLCCVTHLSTWY